MRILWTVDAVSSLVAILPFHHSKLHEGSLSLSLAVGMVLGLFGMGLVLQFSFPNDIFSLKAQTVRVFYIMHYNSD